MTVGQEIVESIWKRSEGKYVFLPQKIFGRWEEGEARWMDYPHPGTFEGSLPEDTVGRDSYFSVARFTAPQRRLENVGKTGVLYADLDSVEPESLPIRPTIAWETSPGMYQAVWFLPEPLPPETHEPLNKAWNQHIGADTGSWIPTKVLRIPGTLNWKRRKAPWVPYGQVLFRASTEYPPETFMAVMETENRKIVKLPEAVSMLPTEEMCETARAEYQKGLPLRIKAWLNIRNPGDRSRHIRKLAVAFAEEGYTPTVAFAFIEPAPFNKFKERPQELWKQVNV